MRFKFKKHNTLRNQILFVFLLVMLFVLTFVGSLIFSQVSDLLKKNAEKQIYQTAIQATGRVDSLYEQIDMLSTQIATNSIVQQQLQRYNSGHPLSYQQRQTIMQISNSFQAYSNGISNIELYTYDYKKILPLDEESLINRLEDNWIKLADQAKGKLVWVGVDPKEPEFFLAIKRVSLIDKGFSNGGYLLVQLNANYFDFVNKSTEKEVMILIDQYSNPITSNFNGNINQLLFEHENNIVIGGDEYILIKEESSTTDWTLTILTPVETLTEGISIVRSTILLSAGIGGIVFFLFSYILSTLITRPINHLSKTMLKAKKGELKKTPETKSSIEIMHLNESYNQLVDNTNHLIQVVYEKELIRSRTELKALQAQINPHFLFNTLDALYWSLEEKGENELAEIVIAMSELFRYTISNQEKNEWVSLKQALEHVESYMRIMKIRFGDRFTYNIKAPMEYEELQLPKLLIQPLVENAISHGIGNKAGTGSVSVIVELVKDSNNLSIKVIDDGVGMDQETIERILKQVRTGEVSSLKGNGVAIANVNKRLQLYYQDSTYKGITITSEVNKGTCFMFEIPLTGGKRNYE
ncbi:sensor histidine kinase [Litchfieldia salsa]|uniref:histidine kinase n=1 Tax=Litchfieldia salsa TaxID=930152 RepID=A0A1H0RSN1_9BACI|nr:sensor histidine kinase [Litchfieldia salsa]SDP32467.1 two-component system, sensor histidine kinase YesM [Litchfieldia salsa]